jgi:hypothetical protein
MNAVDLFVETPPSAHLVGVAVGSFLAALALVQLGPVI